MRLIDFSITAAQENSFQQSVRQVREKLTFLGKTNAQIQQLILARFQRSLDSRFTMIQNFTPTGYLSPIPFILVGPTGITVVNLNMEKGIYRIKEDSWQELNKTTRKYSLARVNLVKQTQAIAQTIRAFLAERGQTIAEVTPVLLLADPGMHVEQNRPAIRVVLADGIENLIISIVQAIEILNPMEVKAISDIFDNVAHPVEAITGVEEDFFGKDLGLGVEKPKPKPPRPVPELNLDVPPFIARLEFSRKQWIILGAIVLVNILVLMGAILVVAMMSG